MTEENIFFNPLCWSPSNKRRYIALLRYQSVCQMLVSKTDGFQSKACHLNDHWLSYLTRILHWPWSVDDWHKWHWHHIKMLLMWGFQGLPITFVKKLCLYLQLLSCYSWYIIFSQICWQIELLYFKQSGRIVRLSFTCLFKDTMHSFTLYVFIDIFKYSVQYIIFKKKWVVNISVITFHDHILWQSVL